MTTGSGLWQALFFSFALILILFEVVRGWRLGLVRQGVRLVALIVAYGAAIFGGRLLLPVLRPLLHAPDLFISLFSGALCALFLYALINAIGSILFRRTGEQRVGLVRLLYGICGAVLGIFFGLFSVWLVVVAIRSLGAIAGAEPHREATMQHASAQLGSRPDTATSPRPTAVAASLAKLKNSIEMGPLGEALKAADVVPAQTYRTLGKVGFMVSSPQSAERFLSFPGAKELAENPKIIALRDDPEIIDLIKQQRFLDLLQNPKLIEAMNDPALAAQVRSFDFQKALDYATRK
ncbi:MAG TPA: CvpA family protein [Chthoniobacteraceae bacterium]|nr:CvpA family protein [Chthoniobacteraceae bacterium]